jgi:serine/threonine-protein kinase
MASVWVARLLGKHGFEKLVAIKTILPKYARDPLFQQMFLDEARIASRIRHPNVVQTLDLGDQGGVLFLVMEWLEGDSLSKLVEATEARREPFPLGIALRIATDVCAGLHAAHELRDGQGVPLGIVHRDVSPHNLLIDERGVGRIIDFGIAKARDRGRADTEAGALRGKVRYMSPEQVFSPRATDRRADVWAVGGVLYALFCGRPPYQGPNDLATLAELGSKKPPRPLPDHVPEPIRHVVSRALAWDMNERYATAAELQTALEAATTELKFATTNADVAAFCAFHLTERAAARKSAVAFALSEANERVRLSPVKGPGNGPTPTANASLAENVDNVGTAPASTTHHASTWEASLASDGPPSLPMDHWILPVRRYRGIAIAIAFVAIVALGIGAAASHGGGYKTTLAAPVSMPSTSPPTSRAGHPSAPPPAIGDPSEATTSTAPLPVPSSVASAIAPSAPAISGSPSSPRPSPSAHRAPETRSSMPNSDSPAPSGTTKHRNEYGF